MSIEACFYGLKQAPRAWFQCFSSFLMNLCFLLSQTDSFLFVHYIMAGTDSLLLYVDVMVLTKNNPNLIKTFIIWLSKEIVMKDLGSLHCFLGVEVQHDSHGVFLSQTKYGLNLLQRADMVEAKPIATLFVVGEHLSTERKLFLDPTLFQSLVGALQYLTISRPNLSFSVNSICQYMHTLIEDHFQALKRILRYVKDTVHHGL